MDHVGLQSPEFAVVVTAAGAETIVTVRGDVDISTAPVLRHALVQAEARHHGALASGPVVVDLSGVTFLDARGLDVLVGAETRARRRGGHIVLRRPSRMTLRVLEFTRLLSAFHINSDLVAARDVA